MFLYFKEGDPQAVVAPDVFVVVGAPKHNRMSYKLWEVPKAPDFVLEVTSRSTPGRRTKAACARCMRRWASASTGCSTRRGDWLAPRIQGFSLHGNDYRRLPEVTLVSGGSSLHSDALGLDVRLDADGPGCGSTTQRAERTSPHTRRCAFA